MASEPSRSRIEDDWQEIDDACSVRSLSTSDGEAPDPDASLSDKPDLARSTSTLTGVPLPTTATTDSSSTDDTKSSRPESSSVSETEDRGPTGLSTDLEAMRLDQPPSPRPYPAVASPSKADTCPPAGLCSNTTFGKKTDIVDFHGKITLVRALLASVLRETASHMDTLISFRTPIMYKIYDTTQMLQEQVQELAAIVHGCLTHIDKHSYAIMPKELPLSPSLPQWLSNLNSALLALQVQMDVTCSEPSVTAAGGFSKSADNLEDLRLAMADFLPVIKSDYDEFRTKHMSFAAPQTPPATHSRQDADPTVAALRQTFYQLLDEVREMLSLLSAIHTVDADSPIKATAPPTISSLATLRDAIMLVLTNNPSEWIDLDLASKRKILSYPAFIALSPDMLQDVTSHLRQIREDLDVANDQDVDASPQMIHEHQIVLLTEGDQMHEIESTVNFLESLLVPQTHQPRD